jgi:hypothetical protein
MPLATALVTAMRGIAARSAMERAVYSDSIVLVAIVDCNLDTQSTGQPATSIMWPVQDLTDSGFVPHSDPHPHAKAALT